jgi:gluconolactonase
MKYEVVLADLTPGEGPVWCSDGTLVISHIAPGCLRRIWPETGRSEIAARTGGGANSAYPASDGGFVVTQNGGMDFSKFAGALGIDASKLSYSPATPGLQRVRPNGDVSYLADQGFQAPNDLIVASDGTLYFTDPPQLANHDLASGGATGRFWEYTAKGSLRCIAEGFQYCNGVALSPSGRLVIVEKQGLLWIDPRDGAQEWFVQKLPGVSPGDGMCYDTRGTLYLACPTDHCIRVLDERGKQVEQIDLGANAYPTNCCIGGAGGRTLFTTELGPGRVCAVEGLPAPALPLRPWAVPAT